MMKKIHALPNIVTALGLCCGLFVIFKMTMTPIGEVDEYILTKTAAIMLLAVMADVTDGAIARIMHAESIFGSLFDSLADAITFGLAPSVIVLKTFSIEPGTNLSFLITLAAMIYSVCGVLRLVRFGVQSQNAQDDLTLSTVHQKNFTGLPIPAAAGAVVSANLLMLSDGFQNLFGLGDTARFWIMLTVLFMTGYLMVSQLKFPSLKTLQVRVSSFQIIVLTVLMAVVIFYGILYHFAPVFFFAAWGYLFVSLLLSFIRLISGKKSKTLEDFEPDEEDEF